MGMNDLMMKLRIYITCVSIIVIVCSDYLFEQSVELSMIHMCMRLSVQSKCFMFHYTDYQPPQLLHLYCCHMDFFSFFSSKDGKTRFLMYYNVYKESSLMFIS